jgi:hypothetical protein
MAFLHNFYYYVTSLICLWNQLIMAEENYPYPLPAAAWQECMTLPPTFQEP